MALFHPLFRWYQIKYKFIWLGLINCQDEEDSEEQCALNNSKYFSWGLESVSLKRSYEFIIINLSL